MQCRSTQLTRHLVSIVGWRDICIINTPVHANSLPEVVDLVKTQLAVQVEEYDAVPYRQVRVRVHIPDIEQVLVVQQEQCITNTEHKAISHSAYEYHLEMLKAENYFISYISTV